VECATPVCAWRARISGCLLPQRFPPFEQLALPGQQGLNLALHLLMHAQGFRKS
jgi:hypothetical protein